MSLSPAHKGYEYQDILSAYFILKEILNETKAEFYFDKKMHDLDVFDDVTVRSSHGIFKKQIKHSEGGVAHILNKDDFSSRELSLDILFNSWFANPDKDVTELRICLAWDFPLDELVNFLKPSQAKKSFIENVTNIYKFNVEIFWPEGETPPSSWRKFKNFSETISRDDFVRFIDDLEIELRFPPFSQNIYQPAHLEKIVLSQIRNLGVGSYPNNQSTIEEFSLRLIAIIRRLRSNNGFIGSDELVTELGLRTDFGAIPQEFPVDESKNVHNENFNNYLWQKCQENSRIALTGEPGSGKSWFIDNFKNFLNERNVKVIRHLCYTDLKDDLGTERIKLNVFLGNLIKDILDIYPELSEVKQKKYASDITELNLLLKAIKSQTVIIIDGLDHIERILNYSQADLKRYEVDIINHIKKIELTLHVQIIISSQPIEQFETFNDFHFIVMPRWSIEQVRTYMEKVDYLDMQIENSGTLLSEFIFEKCDGNPLYLNYLIQEIQKLDTITLQKLIALPEYNFNLENYYSYLLKDIDINIQLSRIFSAINFPLNKTELKEITHVGNLIDDAIDSMLTVLKQNFATSGYTIYHESFRRYVLKTVEEKNVYIIGDVYEPMIRWFSSKNFFKDPKSFRYYLALLNEANKFESTLEFLKISFVANALAEGNSWNAIEKNYYYFLKAAIASKDFVEIVILNELNKIIFSTADNVNEQYLIYLETLGYLKGFPKVAEYLSFEGKPTIQDFQVGIRACYLCEKHNSTPPWNLYDNYFATKFINREDYKYYITYQLSQRNIEELKSIAKRLIERNAFEFANIFYEELSNFHDKEFLNSLEEDFNILTIISDFINSFSIPRVMTIEELADEILKIRYPDDKDVKVIKDLLNAVMQSRNEASFEVERGKLIKKFAHKNWFYNWLIYCIQIYSLDKATNVSSTELLEIFGLLVQDTDPFEGSPRTVDLYKAEDMVVESIIQGLNFIENDETWQSIFDLLLILNNQVQRGIQKSLGGPLTTDKLFTLIKNHFPIGSLPSIIPKLEKEFKKVEPHHLHTYLSEYCFCLAIMLLKIDSRDCADAYFQKGIKYLIGYTFRKDVTALDLVYAMEDLTIFSEDERLSYIKRVWSIVESVYNHTDGKETKHFPNIWFEQFCKLDFDKSIIYLLHEISNTEFSWILEESLLSVLDNSKGTINSVIELLLLDTMPIESSSEFVESSLNLLNHLKDSHLELARKFATTFYSRFSFFKENSLTEEQLNRINALSEQFNIPKLGDEIKVKVMPYDSGPEESLLNVQIVCRKDFSQMSIQEIIEYINERGITRNDLQSFFYLMQGESELNEEIKMLINALVVKNNDFRRYKNYDIDQVFSGNTKFEVFYLICEFIYSYDGWYRELVQLSAFQKACAIDKTKAFEYFFELLPQRLTLGFHNRLMANLIKALHTVEHDTEILKKMLETLCSAIEYRLPYQEKINWENVLENSLGMNNEELLVTILISRFKANTTARYSQSLFGVTYLVFTEPLKMIKPIKWFFRNRALFLTSILSSILSVLYEYYKVNPGYMNNFREELTEIYPMYYYTIDRLIEKLLNLNARNPIELPNDFHYVVNDRFFNYFRNINFRNNLLLVSGFPVRQIAAKYYHTWKSQYEKQIGDLYYNSSKKIVAPNIYEGDYILKLINEDFYVALNEIENNDEFLDNLKISVETIVAQLSSTSIRPSDLIRPSELVNEFIINEPKEADNFIRLAHYEKEFYEVAYDTNIKNSFGGISFMELEPGTIPSNKFVSPVEIWNVINFFELDETITSSLCLKDDLENFKVVWLHSELMKYLNLKPGFFLNGLYALNSENETVLKLNYWKCDYIGPKDYTNLDNEIPKLEGCELIIRKDYFEKILDHFGNLPKYYVTTIHATIIID